MNWIIACTLSGLFSLATRHKTSTMHLIHPVFAVICLCAPSSAAEPAHKDLVFAVADGRELKLDLYLPQDGAANPPPLVVFIHGGGFRAGSYKDCPLKWLAQENFAVASISYRLTDVAVFPAQIHDCKAAIRWLRAQAGKYRYDASKIGTAGLSAGGMLSSLLGSSGGMAALEGTVGDHLDQSSRVQATVCYFGGSDYLNFPDIPGTQDNIRRLLGGSPEKLPTQAALASPITHVSADDPPMLIFHGTRDNVVPASQSARLVQARVQFDLETTACFLKGVGHGGPSFFDDLQKRRLLEFLNRHLRQDLAPEAKHP